MKTELIADAIILLDSSINSHFRIVTESGNFDEIVKTDLKDLEKIIYKGINSLTRQARLVESKIKTINRLKELKKVV